MAREAAPSKSATAATDAAQVQSTIDVFVLTASDDGHTDAVEFCGHRTEPRAVARNLDARTARRHSGSRRRRRCGWLTNALDLQVHDTQAPQLRQVHVDRYGRVRRSVVPRLAAATDRRDDEARVRPRAHRRRVTPATAAPVPRSPRPRSAAASTRPNEPRPRLDHHRLQGREARSQPLASRAWSTRSQRTAVTHDRRRRRASTCRTG